MIAQILKMLARKLIVPLPIQVVQMNHNYHSLSEVIDQNYYVFMYLVVVFGLFLIEIAIKSGWVKVKEEGKLEKLNAGMNKANFAIGLIANIIAFHFHHIDTFGNQMYWVGIIGITAISVMFEFFVIMVSYLEF